ncbi:MAG: ABC transporter permease [Bacteroidetes bacterium]|nr:ABC transporter permease [Bacteroidota bacterium]
MLFHRHIFKTSILQAFQELAVNKLRTFLSLLGITIGIFCIIAVLTVVDSMKNNIKKEMNSLGSDVLYVGRWPWMDEGGEYKWWEFWRRPSMTLNELRVVEKNVPSAALSTLCLNVNGQNLKRNSNEISGISVYATTENFDKLQNIEIEIGRYLNMAELTGGVGVCVLGYDAYQQLFPGNTNPIGETVSLQGKHLKIVGVMKKVGQNMAGFDFDDGMIIPYFAAVSLFDVKSLNYDPFLIVKARTGANTSDLKYEVEGALRQARKVKPGANNNFAINQLSQITERLDLLFGTINIIGWVIAGFSLLVGGFGIANIMFVTVKERTKIIGLKKAIGARSASILLEFLVEAVALCLTGGLLGIIAVFTLSLLMTYSFDYPIILSVKNFMIGMGVSIFVGLVAGIVPANAAAKLDPVVAIRSN